MLFVLIAFSVYLGMNWYVLARLFHLFGLAKNSWFYAGAFLNVSAGTGIWGPPMRLGSHSEIVLLEPMP